LLALLVASTARADDPRGALSDQLAAEQEVLAKTLATVDGKLADVDGVRAHRLRAALRLLDTQTDDPMVAARRRAAVRLLLTRDANERALLAGELDHLHIAQERETAAAQKLPTVNLPVDLAKPAKGKIARHFGTFEHERSHATLSRRGIDIEVEDHAQVSAPEAGTVRYAGPIRGLDNGVIIDHGDYMSILAKLGPLSLPVGTHVERGDHIARAARHRVYLEVRIEIGPGGLPIDPEPLLQ
jgi:septal ring factor EnvC (AmiA/AmiB activator)